MCGNGKPICAQLAAGSIGRTPGTSHDCGGAIAVHRIPRLRPAPAGIVSATTHAQSDLIPIRYVL